MRRFFPDSSASTSNSGSKGSAAALASGSRAQPHLVDLSPPAYLQFGAPLQMLHQSSASNGAVMSASSSGSAAVQSGMPNDAKQFDVRLAVNAFRLIENALAQFSEFVPNTDSNHFFMLKDVYQFTINALAKLLKLNHVSGLAANALAQLSKVKGVDGVTAEDIGRLSKLETAYGLVADDSDLLAEIKNANAKLHFFGEDEIALLSKFKNVFAVANDDDLHRILSWLLKVIADMADEWRHEPTMDKRVSKEISLRMSKLFLQSAAILNELKAAAEDDKSRQQSTFDRAIYAYDGVNSSNDYSDANLIWLHQRGLELIGKLQLTEAQKNDRWKYLSYLGEMYAEHIEWAKAEDYLEKAANMGTEALGSIGPLHSRDEKVIAFNEGLHTLFLSDILDKLTDLYTAQDEWEKVAHCYERGAQFCSLKHWDDVDRHRVSLDYFHAGRAFQMQAMQTVETIELLVEVGGYDEKEDAPLLIKLRRLPNTHLEKAKNNFERAADVLAKLSTPNDEDKCKQKEYVNHAATCEKLGQAADPKTLLQNMADADFEIKGQTDNLISKGVEHRKQALKAEKAIIILLSKAGVEPKDLQAFGKLRQLANEHWEKAADEFEFTANAIKYIEPHNAPQDYQVSYSNKVTLVSYLNNARHALEKQGKWTDAQILRKQINEILADQNFFVENETDQDDESDQDVMENDQKHVTRNAGKKHDRDESFSTASASSEAKPPAAKEPRTGSTATAAASASSATANNASSATNVAAAKSGLQGVAVLLAASASASTTVMPSSKLN